jgi:hypothetical protein
MSDNERRAKLLRRLARLDQMIEKIDDSMTGATLTPTIFVRGAKKIHHMDRLRAKVEVQLMQLKKQ